MQSEWMILGILLLIGIIGNNTSVAVAAGILLVLRMLNAGQAVNFIEAQGINIGIIMLTTAVLAPVAAGRINFEQMKQLFSSSLGLAAIAIGIIVALVAGRGVTFLKQDPLTISAIVVGTIIGVILFRGVPVGPLIAAGIVAIMVEYLKFLQ